jgi:hypothetical protein
MAQAQIELKRIALNNTAARHFSKIKFADPTISLKACLDLIRRGDWVLYGIFENGFQVGSVAVVIEIGDLGNEFFIAMGSSDGQGEASLAGVLPTLEQIAQENKCVTVRTSTALQGLVKIYERSAYTVSEYVLRKVL